MTAPTLELTAIGASLAREIEACGAATPMSCYQCAKCSSGCPVAAGADLKPHELVRMVQMDQREAVLSSRFIWQCTSCHICITRCPQSVDIAAMNDALRAMSVAAGKVPEGTTAPVFNEIFLKSVEKRGRVWELGLMAAYKIRTGRLMEDADKAPLMLSKGKLPLLPHSVPGADERNRILERAKQGGDK